jgi:hypothetical protein
VVRLILAADAALYSGNPLPTRAYVHLLSCNVLVSTMPFGVVTLEFEVSLSLAANCRYMASDQATVTDNCREVWFSASALRGGQRKRAIYFTGALQTGVIGSDK